MKLSEKVKIALEETRILILGAQILLGFGFRGAFSERFDDIFFVAPLAPLFPSRERVRVRVGERRRAFLHRLRPLPPSRMRAADRPNLI
jgi:hypothetical protein